MASAICSVASSCSVSRVLSGHRALGQCHRVQTHFDLLPLALAASEPAAKRPLTIPARKRENSLWGTQSCRLPPESIFFGSRLGFKKSTYFREYLQASMKRSTFTTAASGTTNSQTALDIEQYDKERLELDQKVSVSMMEQTTTLDLRCVQKARDPGRVCPWLRRVKSSSLHLLLDSADEHPLPLQPYAITKNKQKCLMNVLRRHQ